MPFLEGPVSIFYQVDTAKRADARHVVLSNSLGTDLGMWQPQVDALRANFNVVRYDTRGHGRSTGSGPLTTFEELGCDVLRLLDHLQLEQVHFVGLSMGGITGMWLAAHAASRIDRRVLANTAARIGPASIWNARIKTVAESGMPAITPGVLARWFTPAFVLRHPESVAPIEQMLLNTSSDGYIAACHALRDADLTTALGAVRARTLVIVGDSDAATTLADARVLVALIAKANLEVLSAAHLSNIEASAAFNSVLLDFLQE
jgi:3-oxoadipate enol-lactonase